MLCMCWCVDVCACFSMLMSRLIHFTYILYKIQENTCSEMWCPATVDGDISEAPEGNRRLRPFCSDWRRNCGLGPFLRPSQWSRPSSAPLKVPRLPRFLEVCSLCPFSPSVHDLGWPWESQISHNAFHLACTSKYPAPDVLQMIRRACPCTVLLAHMWRTCQPLVEQNFIGFAESPLGPVQQTQQTDHQSNRRFFFFFSTKKSNQDHMTSLVSFPGPCWCPTGLGTAVWTSPTLSAQTFWTRGPDSDPFPTFRSSPPTLIWRCSLWLLLSDQDVWMLPGRPTWFISSRWAPSLLSHSRILFKFTADPRSKQWPWDQISRKRMLICFLPAGKACTGLAAAVGPSVCRCSTASCSSGTWGPGPPFPAAHSSSHTGPADLADIQLPVSNDLEWFLLSPSDVVSYLSGEGNWKKLFLYI